MMSDDVFGSAAFDGDDWEVDTSESGSVPVGIYAAVVKDCRRGTSNAGNPMFEWEFAIIGDENGTECNQNGLSPKTYYTANTPAAMWKLEEILVALGVCDTGETAKFNRNMVVGRQCLINVVEEVYNNRTSSAIDAVAKHPKGWNHEVTSPAGPGNAPDNADANTPF